MQHLTIKCDKYISGVIPVFLCIIMGLAAGCGLTQKVINKKSTNRKKATAPLKPTKVKRKSRPEEPPKPKKIAESKKIHKSIKKIILKNIPKVQREMRGVWIATVNNIDWPSKPGLSVAKQKAELEAILDKAEKLHLNTIFLQVRPAADALYQSPYEPWSYFLTGKQGRPPKPYYDPLRFAVRQAHRRGLELQAWFNPFRAYDSTEPAVFADKSIINTHPKWVVKYGHNYWLNPGIKAARDYSIKIILDVARRYNIDGVFLDDYFYPYPQRMGGRNFKLFPDNKAYHSYIKNHGFIKRGDWRRQNINRFVKQLHDSLRKAKSKLPFGISPFGIWRPGHPPQIKGYDAYARIYADSRKWFRKCWVDYLSPQLYWPIGQAGQSFPILLKWWKKQNRCGRHLWPGLFTNKVNYGWKASQISRQIQIERHVINSPGEIHFSMSVLQNNANHIDDNLLETVYSQPALIPRSPWLSKQKPPQPDASLKKRETHYAIHFIHHQKEKPRFWLIKVKYGDQWTIKILPGWKSRIILPLNTKDGKLRGAVIYAVNRLGNKSPRKILIPGRRILAD
jgi:uncharacterized lipoprotein YddW (UPF0748 family)